MNRFTAIDAFCGAGGLTLGLERAGFDVRLGFDNDPIAIKTLLSNPSYISHPVLEIDVKDVNGSTLLEFANLKPGELDLLAGGPPCQGFSVQRTIGGDNDDRNLLVHEYGDLVREMRPRLFLLENVPGIGGKRGRELLGQFTTDMEGEGYVIHETTLDAQDFGVPQRRRRVIVVGERLETAVPQFRWPVPVAGPKCTVRDTIGGLPAPPDDGTEHPQFPGHRADRLSDLNKKRLQALKPGQGRVDLPDELLADCHRVSADTVGHRNVYGRMEWDTVAPTITARFDSFTRGQFGHPEQVRSISLYEGSLLQTFPTDFRFEGTKVEVARQIGNAVPVRFAEAVGLELKEAIIRSQE